MADTKHIYGLFVVKASDWNRFRGVSVDRNDLPPTYEDWLRLTNKKAETFSRPDWEVVRVEVDLDVFIAWSRSRNLNLDDHARIEYADHIATTLVRARNESKH